VSEPVSKPIVDQAAAARTARASCSALLEWQQFASRRPQVEVEVGYLLGLLALDLTHHRWFLDRFG
jgi:hypothetical protein